MSKMNSLAFYVVSLAFLFCCRSFVEAQSASQSDTSSPQAPFLFATGIVFPTPTSFIPVYWKGGQLFFLPMGQGNSTGFTGPAIIDSDGNVYIVGTVGPSPASHVPVYWKNATLNSLPMGQGNTFGSAGGLATDNAGNLYVDGAVGTSPTSYVPVYWKNATLISLPLGQGNTFGSAGGLATDNAGNLYVAGVVGSSPASHVPVYWKNATLISLPLGQGNSFGSADGLAIDNSGNIYVVGVVGTSPTSYVPVYWKNATLISLPLGQGNSWGVAGKLAMDNSGNVYISGSVWTPSSLSPVYWKNGMLNFLPTGHGDSSGATFNVYVDSIGNAYLSGNEDLSVSSPMVPAYWKNGIVNVLPGNVSGSALYTATTGFTKNQAANAQNAPKPKTLSPEEFLKLVQSGAPEQIQAAIDQGAKVDVRSKDDNTKGSTPLLLAAQYNPDPGVIAILLKAGAKLEETSDFKFTPLMVAALSNGPEVISALLKAGAKVNEKNAGNGETPLMFAAYSNPHAEVVATLLQAGANVNADMRGLNALILAAANSQNPQVISILLDAGADVLVRNEKGLLPLDFAYKNPKLVGTNAYAQLLTATQDSFRSRSAPKRQLDVWDVATNGTAAEMKEAIQHGRIHPSTDRNPSGVPILQLAAQFNPNPGVATALIQKSANVNERVQGGANALADSVLNPNPDIISELLRDGADVAFRNDNGISPGGAAMIEGSNYEWFTNSDGYRQLLRATIAKGGTALLAADRSAAASDDRKNITAILNAASGALAVAADSAGIVATATGSKNIEILRQVLSGAQAATTALSNGSNADAVMDIVTSSLSAVGQATGNADVQTLAEVSSDVQQAIDVASGNSTGEVVAPSTEGGGGAGSGGYHNDWPHAQAVHALLRFGDGPSPPQVAGSDTQRNGLIKAAIVAAWGADKEAQRGDIRDAIRMSTTMHNDLQNAFNLLSNGAPITDDTNGLIISERELKRLAGE